MKKPISYLQAFDSRVDESPGLDRIEIPLIQRDYAQGRREDAVDLIRANFLDVLIGAVTTGHNVGLDFVYGDVSTLEVEGTTEVTLRPLDGQQRLTTLFLLHWYIAFRTCRLDAADSWTRLTYATRPSARLFCERIVANPPPTDVASPACWIRDQPWYLHVWRHDPTIESMLEMVEAIDLRLGRSTPDEMESSWERLADGEAPAIAFHILRIDEFSAGDELYIKMNSRGKPLTPFENFKAGFEKAIEGKSRAKEFSHMVDQDWADTFWAYRGDDDLLDDEFMRYFEFVTEVAEWRSGVVTRGRLEQRAEAIFGAEDGARAFLMGAFDTWTDLDVAGYFTELFTTTGSQSIGTGDLIPLFFGSTPDADLFQACCRKYGIIRGEDQREFSLPETLLLYAVVIHRVRQLDGSDLRRRLRALRNVLEASSSELRAPRMPSLIDEVEKFIVADSFESALATLKTFNSAQVEDEVAKAKFLKDNPELTGTVHRLEDLPVLRGSVAAFDLDANRLPHRAKVFEQLMASSDNWMALSGALLSIGDYSRRPSTRFHFGSATNERVWTQLLTGTSRSNLAPTAEILGKILDKLTADGGDLAGQLRAITADWLQAQSTFGWRYYLAQYDAARSGPSGIYASADGQMGFVLCMLQTPTMRGYFRDPFLSAIRQAGGLEDAADDPKRIGYESSLLWLDLKASGTRIRCVETGFQLTAPPVDEHRATFELLCAGWGIGDELKLTIDQSVIDGELVDAEDRVLKAAAFINDLVAGGL